MARPLADVHPDRPTSSLLQHVLSLPEVLDAAVRIDLEDELPRDHHLRDGWLPREDEEYVRVLRDVVEDVRVDARHLPLVLVPGRPVLDDRLVKLPLLHDLPAIGRDQVAIVAAERIDAGRR